MTTSSPQRLSTPMALARLFPFVRPVLPRMIGGFVVALAAAVMTLIIPLVLQATVDGPIASGDLPLIVWASAGVLVLGVLEALFVYLRRAFVLTPGTAVEYRIRQRFYERLQRRGQHRLVACRRDAVENHPGDFDAGAEAGEALHQGGDGLALLVRIDDEDHRQLQRGDKIGGRAGTVGGAIEQAHHSLDQKQIGAGGLPCGE